MPQVHDFWNTTESGGHTVLLFLNLQLRLSTYSESLGFSSEYIPMLIHYFGSLYICKQRWWCHCRIPNYIDWYTFKALESSNEFVLKRKKFSSPAIASQFSRRRKCVINGVKCEWSKYITSGSVHKWTATSVQPNYPVYRTLETPVDVGWKCKAKAGKL